MLGLLLLLIFSLILSVLHRGTQSRAGKAGEQGFALSEIGEVLLHHAQQLGEDAADGPDVHRVAIVV